jgi:hypothetical protein
LGADSQAAAPRHDCCILAARQLIAGGEYLYRSKRPLLRLLSRPCPVLRRGFCHHVNSTFVQAIKEADVLWLVGINPRTGRPGPHEASRHKTGCDIAAMINHMSEFSVIAETVANDSAKIISSRSVAVKVNSLVAISRRYLLSECALLRSARTTNRRSHRTRL